MPRPTILLVDAHEDSRFIYAAMLAHHGYRVVESECGEGTLEQVLDLRPQLTVLTLSAPADPAWEMLHALRQHPEAAATPVVAVSTTGMAEDRERALALGCVAFLVKPLPPMELLVAARRVIGAA